MGTAEWVVLASIVLQFVAAALAVRMIAVTGRIRAWVLIAAAVALMGIRRLISLLAALGGAGARPLDLRAESVALLISVCMVLGMYWLKPVFEHAVATRQRAANLQTRLGTLSALMSEGVVQFRLLPVTPESEAGPPCDCEVLAANPAFAQLIGVRIDEVTGACLGDLLDLDEHDRAALMWRIRTLAENQSTSEFQTAIPSCGRWLVSSVYPLGEDEFVAILRDATEERAEHASLEQLVRERTGDLERANAELLESNAVKARFLAAMSHELRTPLNSVIGFSGVLLGGAAGELNEEQRRQLEMVQASGKRLLALVNDVLDLSKIDAGAVELEFVDVDMDELCSGALEFVRPEADSKGIQLSFAPCSQRGSLRTAVLDRGKVEQILLNLLSNAVKYTNQGGVMISVDSHDDGRIRVSVADTGCGIAEGAVERIFEEFEQVD